MIDQYLIAAFALLVFFAFVALAYIAHEERKRRIHIEPTESGDWPL